MSLSSADAKRYYLGARRIINSAGQDTVSNIREKVIKEGMKYIGTPYEYDSDRSMRLRWIAPTSQDEHILMRLESGYRAIQELKQIMCGNTAKLQANGKI